MPAERGGNSVGVVDQVESLVESGQPEGFDSKCTDT